MADLLPLNIASCMITGFFTKNSLVPIYAQVIYLHVFWGKQFVCLTGGGKFLNFLLVLHHHMYW